MNKKIVANRTTLALYHAMFELLSKNAFEAITVNDICQKAMVSRTTFYSYFEDKYHLVVFCMQQEREQLDIVKGVDVYSNISKLLTRFEEKRDVYHNIILAQTNRELSQMIVDNIKGYIEYNLRKHIDDEEKIKVFSVFYSFGYAGTITWWLANDFNISAKELTQILYEALVRDTE